MYGAALVEGSTVRIYRAAAMAVQTAEEIDQFLSAVSDEVIATALARPDAPNLNRGSHREYHLDQVEQALAADRHE